MFAQLQFIQKSFRPTLRLFLRQIQLRFFFCRLIVFLRISHSAIRSYHIFRLDVINKIDTYTSVIGW